MNELLYKAVQRINLKSTNLKECYLELINKTKFPKGEYFEKLKRAIQTWSILFK